MPSSETDRVDGRKLEPLNELGSDERLLLGLLLALAHKLHGWPDEDAGESQP